MSEIEHKMAMDSIGFAIQILEHQAEYLRKFVDAERSMHSYLHITDPTLYRKAINSDGLRQQLTLAKGALAFLAAAAEIKGEVATPAAQREG